MREILFRGKRLDNGEWVEGFYCKHDTVKVCFTTDDPKTKHLIVMDGSCDWGFEPPLQGVEVGPSTVGQFTGLLDKNGKRIFEGDIVEDGWVKGVVKFLEGTFDSGCYRYNGWVVECQGCVDHRALSDAGEEWEKPVVLGDIYDNPELLEVTPDE